MRRPLECHCPFTRRLRRSPIKEAKGSTVGLEFRFLSDPFLHVLA